MFAQNMFLLIGLLCTLAGGAVLLVSVYVGLRIAWWQWQRARAERDQAAPRYGPDGEPVIGIARGACQDCGHIFDEVFELDDGGRLCWACYLRRKEQRPGAPSTEKPEGSKT